MVFLFSMTDYCLANFYIIDFFILIFIQDCFYITFVVIINIIKIFNVIIKKEEKRKYLKFMLHLCCKFITYNLKSRDYL